MSTEPDTIIMPEEKLAHAKKEITAKDSLDKGDTPKHLGENLNKSSRPEGDTRKSTSKNCISNEKCSMTKFNKGYLKF